MGTITMLLLLYFLALWVATSSADQTEGLLLRLIEKVDKISSEMEKRIILDSNFQDTNRIKLADIDKKIDAMQKKITAMEASKQLPGLDNKLEQFGKKLFEQQTAVKKEVLDLQFLTRSFKGTLEEGIKKIDSKLKPKKTEPDEEILASIQEVIMATNRCTNTSSETRKHFDDEFRRLDQEWITAHRQMRQISNKLEHVSNTDGFEQHTPHQKINNTATEIAADDVRPVAERIKREFKKLEDLEPKIIHAAHVSRQIEDLDFDEDNEEATKMLSRNLSITLKTLQGSLESNLKSIREGVEVMDEFFINPQAAKEQSRAFAFQHTVEETFLQLDKNITSKLGATGEQIKMFLSTEGLASINGLREELRRSASLLEKENESQLKWRTDLQQGVTKMHDMVCNVTEEIKKCTGIVPRDAIRQDVAKMLRNSMG